ncbi:MAG: hypothetical protein IPF63_10395 [Bacteroidetes bacterium]|nr:hypothetical protein [Bacteroidota bacterium]
MNYIYKLFLLLLIFNTNVLFAQKNLKLVVYKVEAIGGSCKSRSEDFYWSWEDGVGGTVSDQCYGNDNVDAPYTQNITKVLLIIHIIVHQTGQPVPLITLFIGQNVILVMFGWQINR